MSLFHVLVCMLLKVGFLKEIHTKPLKPKQSYSTGVTGGHATKRFFCCCWSLACFIISHECDLLATYLYYVQHMCTD